MTTKYSACNSAGYTRPLTYAEACVVFERLSRIARTGGATKSASLHQADGSRSMGVVRRMSVVVPGSNWDSSR